MLDFFKDCLADVTVPQGWTYSGWHNDACPSYTFGKYQIFIDHADPKQRELGEDSQRFHIILEEEYGDCSFNKSFDDLAAVVAFLHPQA